MSFAAAGRLTPFAFGNIDDSERYAIGAHGIGQGATVTSGSLAQQRVARPERVIDRPSVDSFANGSRQPRLEDGVKSAIVKTRLSAPS